MKEYITVETVRTELDYLAKCKEGCFHSLLANKDGYDIAIVIGWTKFDDEIDKDNYFSNGYRLAIKVAYQLDNSIMQCDYDLDWQLPICKNGEVFDTEHPIYESTDLESVTEDINHSVEDILTNWNEFRKD